VASLGLDDLFSVDPAKFVATRDRLVRELRDEGDKERARDVKLLRRPSVPIWVLNQVARTDPASVGAVLEAAASARRAQADAMSGADPAVLRSALAERRDAIENVAAAAAATIERSGRAATTYERELADTLNVIISNEQYAEPFRTGRLVNIDTDSDAELDIFAGLPEPAHLTRVVQARDRSEERAAEKREREQAEQRFRDANDAHREAIVARDEAQRALEQAQRIVDQRERDREAARAALRKPT
jgi:hypothetical protein